MSTEMFRAGLPSFPKSVLETLVSDFGRGEKPEVEEHERGNVDEWLCYIAVDWGALMQHVKQLTKWMPTPAAAYGDPLPDEALAAVLEHGPSAITDRKALARLMLNANQLIQLHEAIYGDDQLPESEDAIPERPTKFWLGVLDRVAELSIDPRPTDRP